MNSELGRTVPQQTDQKVRFRIRIWFRKNQALRFLGHHDLVRAFERFFRRANIRLASTSGFSPKPIIVFALALPLGVVGNEEIVDVEVLDKPDPDELKEIFKNQAPPGLEVIRIEEVQGRKCPVPRGVVYRIPFESQFFQELKYRISDVLSAPPDKSLCIVSRDNGTVKDIRPLIQSIQLFENYLELALAMNDQGTAKPVEITRILNLEGRTPLDKAVERLRIETE